jgi:DNA polymerase III epsilon subunit-like protein
MVTDGVRRPSVEMKGKRTMSITRVPVVECHELDDAPARDLVCLIDVETTGFSPLRGDRIVEIAVVRLSAGRTTEYVTLVNPLRDVGPTHIHGLTDDDVADAPMFQEIVGDLLEVLDGAVMVAHNVRFDQEFISTEFSAAGVFLPAVPSLCTLELAYRLNPAY